MHSFLSRREFISGSTAMGLAAASGFAPSFAGAQDLERVGEATPFDFTILRATARAHAQSAYRAPDERLPEAIGKLDWDQYQSIHFRRDHALWARSGLPFRMQFFHLGLGYTTPVRMYEVEAGHARQLAYSPSLFDYGKSSLARAKLPKDLGFAGFQLLHSPDFARDIAAFLGASYFRAVGGEMQYGLSARGLAIDCGLTSAEEFPQFTAFWFERPAKDQSDLTIYALLDSPSASGAYRFRILPASVLVMDVDARIYLRKPVQRIGIAPLTSMFEHGENDRRVTDDWRPEIHDSDGLCMQSGRGEWIFRPLTNPARIRVSNFLDEGPRGFGLLQRDRNFDHYQDDGVFYERRPSLWVEPRSNWGKGSIQLVELPAPDETFDNIVAFWNPAEQLEPGRELAFAYRLHWGVNMPASSPLAHAVATRTGLGGIVGQPRRYFSWRFVVDFAGERLAQLGEHARVEPIITASHGVIELTSARILRPIQGYRVMFDLRPNARDSTPVDLRLFLKVGDETLTETWMYQWTPPELRTT